VAKAKDMNKFRYDVSGGIKKTIVEQGGIPCGRAYSTLQSTKEDIKTTMPLYKTNSMPFMHTSGEKRRLLNGSTLLRSQGQMVFLGFVFIACNSDLENDLPISKLPCLAKILESLVNK
jgi:hypothetical protein